MVDRETYICVKSFCYMGDTDGGADFAATARIRNTMDEVQSAFAISDIPRPLARDERSSVCQLCQ